MPEPPTDINMNALTDAVIARAKQLCSAETQSNSLVAGLRHKLKRLKEKLDDKVSYSWSSYV